MSAVFRGCSFSDLAGFHAFLPMRKRTQKNNNNNKKLKTKKNGISK